MQNGMMDGMGYFGGMGTFGPVMMLLWIALIVTLIVLLVGFFKGMVLGLQLYYVLIKFSTQPRRQKGAHHHHDM